MGACLSCLGLSRDPSDEEPSETERLLYDDTTAGRVGYGTAGQSSQASVPDPEEVRRHREMLERICAETADNLIDVQHTNLLTLRGKPSAEFAALLNTHFATPSPTTPDAPRSEPDTPRTPTMNHPSSPPEPASPFTRAQIQAAAQSNGHNHTQTHQQDTLRPSALQQSETARTDAEEDEVSDEEAAAEDAWLASIASKRDKDLVEVKWDEIRHGNAGGLVTDLSDVEGLNERKGR